VVQKVDGAHRLEATRAFIGSDIGVEPETLQAVEIHKGGSTVREAVGAMGGTLDYKTIEADELLLGNKTKGAKLKAGYESVTEGNVLSVTAAAKDKKGTKVLFQATTRKMDKVESGEGEDSLESEKQEVQFTRNTYLLKVNHQSKFGLTQTKLEHSSAKNLEATYRPGAGDANTNYKNQNSEAILKHHLRRSSLVDMNAHVYFNESRSLKETYAAFRGFQSTLGTTEDVARNGGLEISNQSVFEVPELSGATWQMNYGLSRVQSNLGEKTSAANSYFGESEGYEQGIYVDNEVLLFKDRLSFLLGGRVNQYHRQTNRLNVEAPTNSGTTNNYMVGLSYRPAPWVQVSAKSSLTERAPQLRELYYGDGKTFSCHRPLKVCSEIPNSTLLSEGARTKEVSALFQSLDQMYPKRLKLTYFDEGISNYIERMPVMFREENGKRVLAGPDEATHREYQNINLSQVLRRGIESQAQVEWKNWEFTGSYALIRMDCLDCPDRFNATKVNEPMPSAPADKITLRADYTINSYNLRLGAEGLFVESQERLSDRYLQAEYGTEGYSVYGLDLTWEPGKQKGWDLRVDVAISNLFDKQYVTHFSSQGTFELGRSYNVAVSKVF
jgi:hemoglobin/transferrin/lactoferrin receptor protein